MSLSLIGKVVFPILAVAGIGLLFVLANFIYTMFLLTRRWVRRVLIPRNINLHLDRDKSVSRRREPKVAAGEPIEYGGSLKERIKQMHEEA